MRTCKPLRRILRWLTRPEKPKPVATNAGARSLMTAVHVHRIERAARREGVSPHEFEDAITLLATSYPVTKDEVLAVVEAVGLARARAQIEASIRGDD